MFELYKMRCLNCGQLVDSKYADPSMRHNICESGGECELELIGDVPKTDWTPRTRKLSAAVVAHATWLKAGRPTRTPEAVSSIFATCEACQEYREHKEGVGHCNLCGCYLRRSGGLLNKIRMATEHCPLGKW